MFIGYCVFSYTKTMDTLSLFNMGEYCIHDRLSKLYLRSAVYALFLSVFTFAFILIRAVLTIFNKVTTLLHFNTLSIITAKLIQWTFNVYNGLHLYTQRVVLIEYEKYVTIPCWKGDRLKPIFAYPWGHPFYVLYFLCHFSLVFFTDHLYYKIAFVM